MALAGAHRPESELILTGDGRATLNRLIAARRIALADLLSGRWPEAHADVGALLDWLARSFVNEIPSRYSGHQET
jgi:hypothetical protein